jgi:hypothetical protein
MFSESLCHYKALAQQRFYDKFFSKLFDDVKDGETNGLKVYLKRFFKTVVLGKKFIAINNKD